MRTLGLAIALSACAASPSDPPTWLGDVRPILAANCVRCHSGNGLGGAPTSFRLDVYDDGARDGQIIRGAASMAEFIVARASVRGDMPPRGPTLSGQQKDVLRDWARGAKERGTMPPGNHAPTATAQLVDGNALRVTVSDSDDDLVTGVLRVTGGATSAVLGPLQSGTQELPIDDDALDPGAHSYVAAVDDGRGEVAIEVRRVVVPGDTNVAPRLEFHSPVADTLFTDADVAPIEFDIADPDTDDRLTVDLVAELGGASIRVATGLEPRNGVPETVALDVSSLPEGTSWHLVATYGDGLHMRTATSAAFIVSHASTTETYESVKPIIDAVCARCHDAHLPGGPRFGDLDDLRRYRGRAWRKLAEQQEMPPRSMSVILDDPHVLTAAERGRLGAWLFAGAPP